MPKVTKDAKGHLHVYLPGRQMGKLLATDMAGAIRTVARGDKHISVRGKPRDMKKAKFEQLKALLVEFLGEEEQEAEHQHDACTGDAACDCGCSH